MGEAASGAGRCRGRLERFILVASRSARLIARGDMAERILGTEAAAGPVSGAEKEALSTCKAFGPPATPPWANNAGKASFNVPTSGAFDC